MKMRMWSTCIAFILIVIFIIGSLSLGGETYIAKENEELFGTWINPEYDNSLYCAKIIFKPDGTFEDYPRTDSTRINWQGKYSVTYKWTDSEGNIWYKYVELSLEAGSSKRDTYYVLAKISNSGTILETVLSGLDYPTELGPDVLLYTYNIFYRK